ncbi:META domain-containing protein [Pontiellaceae bacterium B12219]|nr:META domain-containing protein [Pontiellaceae bacterium B12219]
MILKQCIGAAGLGGLLLLLSACQMPAGSMSEVQTYYVAPQMADDGGAEDASCLLVKQSSNGTYRLMYSPIVGFNYVPGFEYVLEVEVSENDDVPPGDSEYAYRLVKVVSKKTSALAIDSTVWELTAYQAAGGAMKVPVTKSGLTLKVAEGKISGHAGVNQFFGKCDQKEDTLQITSVGSTRMTGSPELMVQESQFLGLLQRAVNYQIVGSELRLRNTSGSVILKFKPLSEPSLTSGVWEATGINNGLDGVVSIMPFTKITMEFSDAGTASGGSGCNSYSGRYTTEGHLLSFGPMSKSDNRCSAPQGIMEQEMQFFQALENVTMYSFNKNMLKLLDKNGSVQLSFIQKD